MLHAAPGEFAREALRRNFPEYRRASFYNLVGCTYNSLFQSRIVSFSHPCGSRIDKCSYFTPHFSFFEVERGRLGEVVSLVGDCRPPPPGNPHRPSTLMVKIKGCKGMRMSPGGVGLRSEFYNSNNGNAGGFFVKVWKHCSFNKYQIIRNLKELNKLQYFKNNCSYTSCT